MAAQDAYHSRRGLEGAAAGGGRVTGFDGADVGVGLVDFGLEPSFRVCRVFGGFLRAVICVLGEAVLG